MITLAPSGRVAMIERYVRGRRYFSVPGGRLESGESPEQAAVREIEEELGLRVTLAGRLPDYDDQAYFLAVVPKESKLRMSGPEARHSNRNNRYTPRWVDLATLETLPLRHPVLPLVTTAALTVSATMTTLRTAEAQKPGKTPLSPKKAAEALATGTTPTVVDLPSAEPTRLVPEPGPDENGTRETELEHERPQAREENVSREPEVGPEPRPEFDPAAATFAFSHRLRRRFVLRPRSRSRAERADSRR